MIAGVILQDDIFEYYLYIDVIVMRFSRRTLVWIQRCQLKVTSLQVETSSSGVRDAACVCMAMSQTWCTNGSMGLQTVSLSYQIIP